NIGKINSFSNKLAPSEKQIYEFIPDATLDLKNIEVKLSYKEETKTKVIPIKIIPRKDKVEFSSGLDKLDL
ncbi:MAG: hypothetical protein ACE5J3_09275, partial [Methanosarcinales archaeon]